MKCRCCNGVIMGLRDIVVISRLKNVILSSITVCVGAWVAAPSGISTEFYQNVILLMLAVAAFVAAGNIINDIMDYESDLVNHPNRILPQGLITLAGAKKCVIGFSIFSLLCVLTYSGKIYQDTGTIPFLTILIWSFAGLLIVTYEMGPSTKKQGLVGNIAISALVGLVIVFGATANQNSNYSLIGYVSITAFLINLSREIIKDCEDIEGDSERNTLPMRIGLENARMIGYVLALSAIVFASIPYYLHVGGIRIGMLIWQAPTLLNVITLNGVLQSGDDYRAQKRLRIAMLTGLFGFVASVAMI